jgi:uncharacterized protein YjiS (DUF1127 family)
MRRHILDLASSKERRLSLKALVGPVLRWRSAARSRRHLLDLNNRMLRDIGLSRYEVLHGAVFHSNVGQEPDDCEP